MARILTSAELTQHLLHSEVAEELNDAGTRVLENALVLQWAAPVKLF